MTTAASMRARYAADAVQTASPAKLLVMLYDRLVRDLVGAEQALADGRPEQVNDLLQHAQQIVLELGTSLDRTAWDGAAGLAALYDYLHQQLVTANLAKDADVVRQCRDLVEPLRDAWRAAALETLAARPA